MLLDAHPISHIGNKPQMRGIDIEVNEFCHTPYFGGFPCNR